LIDAKGVLHKATSHGHTARGTTHIQHSGGYRERQARVRDRKRGGGLNETVVALGEFKSVIEVVIQGTSSQKRA